MAGRKVIFYLDGLSAGEARSFSFLVKARFPVRAVIPDSAAYLYYDPDIRAEDQGHQIAVKSSVVGGCTLVNLRVLAEVWLQPAGPDHMADTYADRIVDLHDFAMLAERWIESSTAP